MPARAAVNAAGAGSASMKKSKPEPIPVMDRELETALFHRLDAKRCAVCGALFTPGSNRAKYCPECAGRMKRIKAAQRKRKQRAKCHALGAENPL